MKKAYQVPSVDAIELLTEDILDGSATIVEPTNKQDSPVVVGPSIDITLF